MCLALGEFRMVSLKKQLTEIEESASASNLGSNGFSIVG